MSHSFLCPLRGAFLPIEEVRLPLAAMFVHHRKVVIEKMTRELQKKTRKKRREGICTGQEKSFACLAKQDPGRARQNS